MIRLFIIVFISIFTLSFNFGQNDSLVIKPDCNYFKSYISDSKRLITSPVKWNYKEWCGFAGFTATTLLTIKYDENIYNYFDKQHNLFNDNLSKYGLEPWGSGLYTLPVMGLFYLQGSISGNTKSKNTALLGTKAFIYSAFFVQIPKYLFNRHRPYNDITPDPYLFDGPFTGKYYKSFFSGHTTCVFSVATVVSSVYNDKPWVAFLSYTIATLSGISRVYDKKHWGSDVVAGAFLGYAIGKFVYNENYNKIKINLYTDYSTNGIKLTYYLNQ
ncbi:MAG: hypothetical protein Kow0068_25090 [Marinilabiliales bacterium]